MSGAAGDRGRRGDAESGPADPPAQRLITQSLLSCGWAAIVPSDDLAEFGARGLAVARRLFALPLEHKRSFTDPAGQGHAGWRADSRGGRPDQVWQLTGPGPELWPAELAAERKVLDRLKERCVDTTAAILAGLASAIDIAAHDIRQAVSATDSTLRLLHYTGRDAGLGFAPHTDLGLATFFAGETTPALELEGADGSWESASSGWVVAAGEMLTRWTNGGVRAGRHRVRSSRTDRWAIAVFIHPPRTFELGTDLEGRPVTASEFFERAMSAYTSGDTREPGVRG